jgi:uncharacterized repeat protein (TIGR03803 family)
LPSPVSRLLRQPTDAGYKVLQSFDLYTNGAFPNGGLTLVNGVFYGATLEGGKEPCKCGAVFSITPDGKLKVIYSFKGGTDGELPQGPVLALNGELYGSTYGGGAGGCGGIPGCGTIFKVSAAGAEKVVYRFAGYGDGARPNGGLVSVNGRLYGTASVGGGGEEWGTVFSVTTSGNKKTLYAFQGGSDGEIPANAPLLVIHDVLYGTTLDGGVSGDSCSPYGGCGTAYKVTTSGKETVLHEFTGDTDCTKKSNDGATPAGGLIAVGSTIYGTTEYGGLCSSLSFAPGIVFTMTTAGKDRAIHDFDLTDGALPTTPLTYSNGAFYGTTGYGGSSCPTSNCDGVIFSMSKAGKETVLWNFKGRKYGDGADPSGALIPYNGKLYGITTNGGKNSGSSWRGYGTFFEISP